MPAEQNIAALVLAEGLGGAAAPPYLEAGCTRAMAAMKSCLPLLAAVVLFDMFASAL